MPLMPRPITSPSCTKTQPTGVSSERRAISAISMALRMKPSWYSRFGIGPNTIFATVVVVGVVLQFDEGLHTKEDRVFVWWVVHV